MHIFFYIWIKASVHKWVCVREESDFSRSIFQINFSRGFLIILRGTWQVILDHFGEESINLDSTKQLPHARKSHKLDLEWDDLPVGAPPYNLTAPYRFKGDEPK